MRFITSIFMMLTATCAVIAAYFIGHGLVVRHEGETWPWLAAISLWVAAALFGFIYLKLSKNDPQPAGHAHGAHGHGDTHGAHVHTHADGTVHTHPHGTGHHS